MFTIMLVEDDPKITQLLQSHIEKYGYQAVITTDFKRVAEQFREVNPHLLLLDVNLPLYDGYYWCRQIRQISTCPIVFISAREGSMDQIMALDNGADDYITKPFDYEIVMAKIRSHLRRVYGSYAPKQGERTVELSGLILYPERLMVTIHEKKMELGYKESILLETLMERPMRVVSRDRLLDRLWDDQHFIDDNTLNVYVTRVRKKLREIGIDDALETVRGVGYILKVTWSKSS